jgi:DNA-binding NtrC family response regulator
MKKEVVVLDTDQKQGNNLCRLLTDYQYETAPLNSLKALDDYLEQSECRALIMNLDNISVTNKILKQLKAKNPLINIIAVSERQFHPELEEALREYISVCLAKPVDTDELMYWLKTIFQNDNKPEG